MAQKTMKKKYKIRAIEFRKFDGTANRTSFIEIKNNLLTCDRIDLIPREKIVKLNIRWCELYCVCGIDEWDELYKILYDNEIKIEKRKGIDLILDILDFFFIQPIELIINRFRR